MITDEERAELLKKKEGSTISTPSQPSPVRPYSPSSSSYPTRPATSPRAVSRTPSVSAPRAESAPLPPKKTTDASHDVPKPREEVIVAASPEPEPVALPETAPKAMSPMSTPAMSTPEILSDAVPSPTVAPSPAADNPTPVAQPIENEEAPQESEEKVTYPAICDTCGTEIRVPFQPDGSRPTFCKECFKTYQRTVAKVNAPPSGDQRTAREFGQSAPPRAPETMRGGQDTRTPRRSVEPRSYTSGDQPMSLSQSTLVAPKKFKALRKRPDVDLGAVRKILETKGKPE
jgi:CxxC-x17-CxxC domain-containing protein